MSNAFIAGGLFSKPNYIRTGQYAGTKSISGTTKISTIPGPYRVFLFEKTSMAAVDLTRSDASGAYAFYNLTDAIKYTVVALDHTGTYNAVIADGITAI